jgi:hypothetical protein
MESSSLKQANPTLKLNHAHQGYWLINQCKGTAVLAHQWRCSLCMHL